MSVPIFKELDKSAKDLISKGFPTATHGYEVEGASADGVKFKATATQTVEALNASFETTKTITERGVSIKAVAKSEKNVPVYTLEAAIEPVRVPGLKATFTSECTPTADGVKDTNKLSFLYKRGDLVTVEEAFSYTNGTLSFASSMAVAYQAARAGISALVSVPLNGEERRAVLTEYGFKLGYVPNSLFACVAGYEQTSKGLTSGATLFYKKDLTEAAGEVTIDPNQPAKAPGFTLAVSHATDARTTFKVKAATATPSFAFAVKHQLTEALAVTLASEYTSNSKVDPAAVAHKHGLSVNFKL